MQHLFAATLQHLCATSSGIVLVAQTQQERSPEQITPFLVRRAETRMAEKEHETLAKAKSCNCSKNLKSWTLLQHDIASACSAANTQLSVSPSPRASNRSDGFSPGLEGFQRVIISSGATCSLFSGSKTPREEQVGSAVVTPWRKSRPYEDRPGRQRPLQPIRDGLESGGSPGPLPEAFTPHGVILVCGPVNI